MTKGNFSQTEKEFASSKSFWIWSQAESSSWMERRTSWQWFWTQNSHSASYSDGRASLPKCQSWGSASSSKATCTYASDESARSANPVEMSSHSIWPAVWAYWYSASWSAFKCPQKNSYQYSWYSGLTRLPCTWGCRKT